MRYFIELSYQGKNYSGWQRQENAASVQEVLEQCLSTILNQNIEIVGCGRTDTGVHARQYFAHLDIAPELPENFLYRINRMLPDDIAIQRVFKVMPDLHARFDAKTRKYKYFIHFIKDPFLEDRSHLLYQSDPDIEKMNNCAQQFLGTYDFSCFEKKGSDNKTSVCTVSTALWERTDKGLVFTIVADRFLRNMVRRITAALLMVGEGRLSEQEVIKAVREIQPLDVKIAVPAKGLFLWEVTYDFN
jgi:tRNA pseudouridine38-40 synthase